MVPYVEMNTIATVATLIANEKLSFNQTMGISIVIAAFIMRFNFYLRLPMPFF